MKRILASIKEKIYNRDKVSDVIPKRFANTMIKHVIAVTLFIPYYYSHNDNLYYQDFILVNFFAVLFIFFTCTSWKVNFRNNWIVVSGMGILLIAYNVFATYMNYHYQHWYGEQINTTIAFLFFIVFLFVKDAHALVDSSVIEAVIHMIVISNILSLWFRLVDKYERLFIMNTVIQLREYPSVNSEPYAWLYAHKSQYALILLLCIAFLVVHKKYFHNTVTYLGSQALLVTMLYLSESYTSMVAALVIFAGQFLNYLWKAKWWKKLMVILMSMFPTWIIAKELFGRISENRDVLTLGERLPIWELFVQLIKNEPNGVNCVFGQTQYRITYFSTTNCHNVFLNHMFRFSIPVGGVYAAMFVLIALIAIKRNFSFQTICIWIALFIPMTMDHALSAAELPFFLFMVYCMFFRESKPKRVVEREQLDSASA